MPDFNTLLEQYQRNFRWVALGEALALALSVGAVASKAVFHYGPEGMAVLGGFLAGGALALGYAWVRFRGQGSALRLTQYLNHHYPLLQHSAELWQAAPGQLSGLAALQKQRVGQVWSSLRPQVPHLLKPVLLFCGILWLLWALPWPNQAKSAVLSQSQKTGQTPTFALPAPPLPPALRKAELRVLPPAYTRLPVQVLQNLSARAPEGSQLRWAFQFKGEVRRAWLKFSAQDSLPLQAQTASLWQGQKVIWKNGLYQLGFEDARGQRQLTEFYALETIPDQKPQIQVKGPPEYDEIAYRPQHTIPMQITLQDDYGLNEAFLVATVSRGEGEAVKFKEHRFGLGLKLGQRQHLSQKTLSIAGLEMAPGDELYFFVEAWDNRQPRPQVSRSLTYFVALADTTAPTEALALGDGLKVLPEYFRSQRQLIIDTEKLIREKPRLPRPEFEERSNNIGVDQKILRLRYGRFLGEEFESQIGGHHHHEHAQEEEEHAHEHYEGDGHDDEDEDHRVWKERQTSLKILERNEADHRHSEERTFQSGVYAGVPEDLMHLHDTMEEGTFFDEALQTKLRAALRHMWDAERELRTHHPEASLPYQYQALKLIKEIQQASRVYVARVGFEPPPLEEKGKRLTGDLSKAHSRQWARTTESPTDYPYLQALSEKLSASLSQDKAEIAPALYQMAGEELAQIALLRPGRFLKGLQLIQALAQQKLKGPARREARQLLLGLIWQAMPSSVHQPGKPQGDLDPMEVDFWNRLQN